MKKTDCRKIKELTSHTIYVKSSKNIRPTLKHFKIFDSSGLKNQAEITNFYRPQRSWSKVIFSVVCVKNSVHGGAGTPRIGTPPRQVHPSAGRYPHGQVPPGQVHPPKQCMLRDTGNKHAVRILLECILVSIMFSTIL